MNQQKDLIYKVDQTIKCLVLIYVDIIVMRFDKEQSRTLI